MKEITIFGRGGQGAVTAAQILANAGFIQGYWAQTFPKFGAERRGAPVAAYVRLDHEPISIRNRISAPDLVIVMDLNLFEMLDPLEGIKPDGAVLINCPDGSELPPNLIGRADRLFRVDATRISHEIYGKRTIPVTSAIIPGAYCAAQSDVSLDSVLRALPDFFPGEKLEMNLEGARMGFQNLRGVS